MNDNPYEPPEDNEPPEARKSTASKRRSTAWPIFWAMATTCSYVVWGVAEVGNSRELMFPILTMALFSILIVSSVRWLLKR